MPDFNLDFTAMDQEKLKKTMEALLRGMKFAAAFTPTSVDDKIVDGLITLTSQPWFYDVLDGLLALVGKTPTAEDLSKILSAIK